MAEKAPTIVFFPESAYGPTNNCVGIGNVLKRLGARVVFVVEESFEGVLQAKGFEERLMRLTPKPEVEEEPGQFWKDFIRETAPWFRRSTFEQLEGLTAPIWKGLVDGARYVEPRLREIFAEVRPDVIVEDNVVAFPAILTSGVPWVRIVSCNPLELKDPQLPPPYSGLPLEDPSGWEAFRQEYRRVTRDLWEEFNQFVQEQGAPPLPEGEFMYESPYLNLYIYPAEADYPRSRPLAPTWHRLESSVRTTDAPFELPPHLRDGGPLLYLSLGSLGSADVELMNHLTALLAGTNYRVIVSKGPQHQQIRLYDNMFGEEFLPQTSILPQVDLVITHGGNNTVTECFHFGKPMVVIPLFWDQHDNAQRMQETGFGVRLNPYRFSDAEFYSALERMLGDEGVKGRLQAISSRLQASPGTERAARLILRLAREKRPITSG